LNGAILGMSRQEIKRKFDEIVAFSEVEKFLDTPVKRYSSGMYVRLAFAVAAHLESEILVIDEVLAVGDAEFQKKCLGKMDEVSKAGRTVFFVSHNMTAIHNLCNQAIVMENGVVKSQGSTDSQIKYYLTSLVCEKNNEDASNFNIGSVAEVKGFSFVTSPLISGGSGKFAFTLKAKERGRVEAMALILYSYTETRISVVDLREECAYYLDVSSELTINGVVKALPLVEGRYNVALYINYSGVEFNIQNVNKFDVIRGAEKTAVMPYSALVRGFLELETNFQSSLDK